jgi:hypothetical protein
MQITKERAHVLKKMLLLRINLCDKKIETTTPGSLGRNLWVREREVCQGMLKDLEGKKS